MMDTKQRVIDYQPEVMDRVVVKILFPVAGICRVIQVSLQSHPKANIGRNSQRYMKLVETLTVQWKMRPPKRIFHVP